MGATFVHKVFEDAITQPGDENPVKQIWFVDVDKFALYIFNQLIYDWEISGFFVASSLLGLPKYYTP